MSEYQYYEFQAVDRPLTNQQMADLRAITSCATITPTSLTNVYRFGDFKGEARLGAELVRRLRADLAPPADAAIADERRTIGDLVRASRDRDAEQARSAHERQDRD